jgi:hypothetical protein
MGGLWRILLPGESAGRRLETEMRCWHEGLYRVRGVGLRGQSLHSSLTLSIERYVILIVCIQFCLRDTPTCSCAFCSTNYHCPHCADLPANKDKCRKEEERQARIAAELARRKLKEMQAEYAYRADMAAENVKEFFEGIEDGEVPRVVAAEIVNVSGHLQYGEDETPEGWEVMSW